MWILFAFGSAFFSGLTAILEKCGIQKTDSKNRFNCSNRSEDDYRLNFFMDHGFYCRLTGYYNKFVRKDMDLFNPFRFIYRRLLALLLSGIAGRTCKCCRSD